MRLDDLRAEYDKASKSLEAAKKKGDSAAIKLLRERTISRPQTLMKKSAASTILSEDYDKDPPRQSRAGGPI